MPYVGLIQLTSSQAHLTMLAISRLHASGKIIGSGIGKSRGCEDKTLLLSDASSYCRLAKRRKRRRKEKDKRGKKSGCSVFVNKSVEERENKLKTFRDFDQFLPI